MRNPQREQAFCSPGRHTAIHLARSWRRSGTCALPPARTCRDAQLGPAASRHSRLTALAGSLQVAQKVGAKGEQQRTARPRSSVGNAPAAKAQEVCPVRELRRKADTRLPAARRRPSGTARSTRDAARSTVARATTASPFSMCCLATPPGVRSQFSSASSQLIAWNSPEPRARPFA